MASPARAPALRTVRDAALVALLSLAAGELALRLWHHVRPVPVFFDQSYNRFRGRPGSRDYGFALNSRGFKDLEFGPRRPGSCRVVALGDSHAFGVVPYEDNYLTLLEQRLPSVEVLNLGIPGIGPVDQHALLVSEGLALDPDLVLLSFCIGNDVEDCRPRRREWFEHSHLTALAHFALVARPRLEGRVVHPQATYDDDAPTQTEQAFRAIMHRRGAACLLPGGSFELGLDRAVAELAEMRRVCRARGIGFAVVAIPEEYQVDAAVLASLAAGTGVAPGDLDLARPNRLLGQRLERLGIPHLDLLPRFAEEGRARRLYKPRDTHWNIAGNQLAAEEVGRWLEATGLVGRP